MQLPELISNSFGYPPTGGLHVDLFEMWDCAGEEAFGIYGIAGSGKPYPSCQLSELISLTWVLLAMLQCIGKCISKDYYYLTTFIVHTKPSSHGNPDFKHYNASPKSKV